MNTLREEIQKMANTNQKKGGLVHLADDEKIAEPRTSGVDFDTELDFTIGDIVATKKGATYLPGIKGKVTGITVDNGHVWIDVDYGNGISHGERLQCVGKVVKK